MERGEARRVFSNCVDNRCEGLEEILELPFSMAGLGCGTNLHESSTMRGEGCESVRVVCESGRGVIPICGKIPHTRFLPRRRANADEVIQVLLSERLRAPLCLSRVVFSPNNKFEHVRGSTTHTPNRPTPPTLSHTVPPPSAIQLGRAQALLRVRTRRVVTYERFVSVHDAV